MKTNFQISVFLILNIFLLNSTAVSQDDSFKNTMDSLENVFETSESDSLRLEAVKELAYSYGTTNPEKHYYYIQRGLELSKEKESHELTGILIQELGYYYRKKGEKDSAYATYIEAKNHFLTHQDSTNSFYMEYELGNLKKDLGKYDDAMKHFENGISYFKTKQDPQDMKYYFVGKFNVASLQVTMEESEKAILAYQDLLKSMPETSEYRSLRIFSLLNITNCYIENDDAASAFQAIEQVELLKPNNPRIMGHLNERIAAIYANQNDYEEALKFMLKALNYYNETGNTEEQINANHAIAKYKLQQNDIDLAQKHVEIAKEKLDKMDKPVLKALYKNYELQSSIYKVKGQYEQALSFDNQAEAIKDSMYSIEKSKAITEIETKFEVERIQLEKEQAEDEAEIANIKSSQRQIAVYVLIFIVLVILVSGWLIYTKSKKNKEMEMEVVQLKNEQEQLTLEKKAQYAELKALKSQMNPHFIFNSLTSIQDLVLQNETETSYDYLVLFAKLVRNVLTQSDNKFILLENEIDFLESYLKLEKLRFKDDFNYTIELNGIEEDNYQIPSLMIQPFIENAIHHGLIHKNNDRVLSIHFELRDHIVCTITDNGIGRTKSSEIKKRKGEKHESFALDAMIRRFDILKNQHGEGVGYEIIDLYETRQATGTKVVVTLPFSKIF